MDDPPLLHGAGIFFAVFLATLLTGCRTDSEALGYRIVAGDVTFVFDVSKYREITKNGTHERRSIEDLSIDSVSVAGEFNGWFSLGWRLKEVTPGLYKLRLPLEQLPGRSPWSFKFIVNDMYWVEPPASACNIERRYVSGFGITENLVLSIPGNGVDEARCVGR